MWRRAGGDCWTMSFLKTLAENPSIVKICHNAKFEYKVLRNHDINLVNFHDTKLAAYLLGEHSTGLKELARQYLSVAPVTFKELPGGRDISELVPASVASYACADADNTLRLWHILERRLYEEELYGVYERVELPLVPVLADMERIGVQISAEAGQHLRDDLIVQLDSCRQGLSGLLGGDINPNSHEQLGQRLKDLGAPIRRLTPSKGLPGTDADKDLLPIRDWNPTLIDAILEYKHYQKLMGYVNNLLELRDAHDVIHTSYNQAGTWEESGGVTRSAPATGRISSSQPGLQHIPHPDTEFGRRLRNVFVARPGRVLLAADVEQEEPRIIAETAHDDVLMRAFAEGQDIYRPATVALYPHTGGSLSDNAWKATHNHERFNGKTFFLAWYYGAGADTLRRIDRSIDPRRCQNALRALAATHPSRDVYLAHTREIAYRDGAVVTLFGRKRWVPKVYAASRFQREEGYREAANHRIQGTAADILKMAMRRIWDGLRGMETKLLLTIHDEVVLETIPEEVDRVKELVVKSFRGFLKTVDLPVSFKVGTQWGEMQ